MATATGLFFVEIHPDHIESWGKIELLERGTAQKQPFPAGESEFWKTIADQIETGKTTNPLKNEVLIFIHGMRGDREPYFSEVLRQMRADYLENPDCPVGQIICLTWKPGKNQRYKTISQESAPALAEVFSTVFLKLISFEKSIIRPAGSRLHLFGNSMAARIFSLAFEKPELGNFEKPIFSTLVFTAADVESADFPDKPAFQKMPKIAERSFFFFNQNDNALRFASWVNGQPMLGSNGPRVGTPLPENVRFIEVTGIRNRTFYGKMSQHTYFSHSPEVVAMIQKIWREGR